MQALVKKDLYTLPKHVFLLNLLWFIPLTNFFTDGSPHKHLILLFLLGSSLILYSNYNTKTSEDMQARLVNSLPVTRKKIVLAKYMTGLIWYLIAFVICSIYVFLFHTFAPFPSRLITPAEYVICLAGTYLFISVYYPFLYAFGDKIAAFLTLFLFITSSIGFQIVLNLAANPRYPQVTEFVESISYHEWLLAGSMLLISLFLTFLSFQASVRIYSKKDL
ncbi:ABC-2 transporter permease [Bacillus weihaiensis]|uniref:ABC transporter permease n=1 Tax=Bacillus weihaiensis TaxID=1547283 RepID=A0A1L3MV51_9BACI|nr:ABC-2 transporter permease [Bacillus weihaiensis]APH06150.1 hypothetical protein A9C19_16150 [Bacillus weihaiensis]